MEVAFSSVLLYVIGEDYNVKSINKTLLDDSTRIAISAISENSELALEILERTTSGSLGLDLLAPCQGSSSGPAHKMGRIELSGKVATLYRVLNLANGLLIKSSSKSLVSFTVFLLCYMLQISSFLYIKFSQCIDYSSICLLFSRTKQPEGYPLLQGSGPRH